MFHPAGSSYVSSHGYCCVPPVPPTWCWVILYFVSRILLCSPSAPHMVLGHPIFRLTDTVLFPQCPPHGVESSYISSHGCCCVPTVPPTWCWVILYFVPWMLLCSYSAPDMVLGYPIFRLTDGVVFPQCPLHGLQSPRTSGCRWEGRSGQRVPLGAAPILPSAGGSSPVSDLFLFF